MASDDATADELLVEVHDRVAWLTLNRPAALNSVNPAMLAALHSAVDRIVADDDVRAIVLTGTGRAFCAGADLGVVNGAEADAEAQERRVQEFVDGVNAFLKRLESLPLPVIAALNGMTLGAGLEFALCADFVVATASARIGDGHARYGLLPGGGASARLPRRVAPAAAKWLSFTGDLVEAAQLLPCGLVQCVFPDEEFAGSVARLARRIASRSPLALRRVKTLIDNALLVTLEQALADERAMLIEHRSSWDRAEGLRAFAERRDPEFRGR